MPLGPGTRLGSYELGAVLGAGGMGEVYRARDTRLGREVAIKVVLEAFLADRDRLARFEREARALAAINHPNIATLHGIEESEGRHFLVMELVDGLTLGEHLARGPIALDVAVAVARQIAEALEAAHEKGIVHRDLKPANVKITPDDKVKVLDFGLAKTGAESNSASSISMANSPTLTAMGTQAGMILGTASYMSPEQARGMSGDHRSDVFSFGVVLYEMLTGRQPFQGDTVSDVLASVLARDPDLAALPPDVAPRLSELVKRCLEKHPKRRWQAIGDVRHELEMIAANPRRPDTAADAVALAAAARAKPKPLWRQALPVAIGILVTAAATSAYFIGTRPVPSSAPAVARFPIPFPAGTSPQTVRTALAISPDGTTIAYGANREIYVRPLAEMESKVLARAATNLVSVAISLAFSPDGKTLAYWESSEGKIKRLDIVGGLPAEVCAAQNPYGVTWHGQHIYFSNLFGIYRVLASGGDPTLLIKADPDVTLTAPQVLDDGRLLYSASAPVSLDEGSERWLKAKIVLHRPGDEKGKNLVEAGTDPRYLASGHLIYQAGGVLVGRRFDPHTDDIGGPTPLENGVMRASAVVSAGLAWYSVSPGGTLVYLPGPIGNAEQNLKLAWFDRAGKPDFLPIPAGPYMHQRVSPDGKRITYSRSDSQDTSVWVYEIGGGASPRRLTRGGRDRFPIWSSDSQWVIFQSDRGGDLGLYRQRANGTGLAERLTTADKAKGSTHFPETTSADVMLFSSSDTAGTTLMAYSFKDGKVSSTDIVTQRKVGAEFSRDGQWLAYGGRAASQTGASSIPIFVAPYPLTATRYQISASQDGGHHPVWSPDSREVFFTPGPGSVLYAMGVTTSPSFSSRPGEPVARPFTNGPPSLGRSFDISSAGPLRFLGLIETGGTDSTAARPEFRVVFNWTEELKARVK